ncbi:ADP-ribosylglycohydrolase family protein [Roseimicrobium sp. ORNL1]|uniref:ADP-ribosylglycohydrolase family protein n=1 Tax=Roseimicrobium sp. ORNL1 TaxID=2711231 RepID=UPI0013E1991F|nr:ADP-ribosylglycohydrolase family protein [Roseimicrobium sp. ORNL1]QIF00228.1 ADP-ribosylglycohydrolase family protein [Roseimicrobium sp. ORNL1]
MGDRITGLILGAAVGDALGLPAEGMSANRIARRWPGALQHRFLFGRGMVSDDTEHVFFTAQSLLEAGNDVAVFRRALARRLRWWLLALPAGVGLATARSIVKLWLGWNPAKSGVWSAGNGPAMRSAVIGARFAEDETKIRAFVEASTCMTHRDPKANTGALAVALGAAAVIRGAASDDALIHTWQTLSSDEEWQRAMALLRAELARGSSVVAFSEVLSGKRKREVSGYIYRTVPVALYAWLRHRGDFRATLQEVIACGGDTDTVATIAGALAGSECGEKGIPAEWISGICEWPRSTRVLREIASRAADQNCRTPVSYVVAGVIPRNVFFLGVVLTHGFRRLIPG